MRAVLPILLLASFGLSACSPTIRAADSSLPEPMTEEPVEAQYPVPEAVPSTPEAHTARSGTLAPGALETLAACWFERPYSYMFDNSSPVKVGEGSYGMLQAGIRGILFYGRLNDCAGRLTGHRPRSYSDTSPFEALSGIPVATRWEREGLPFTFFNRDILIWGRDNLLPDPSMSVLGTPAQVIYEGVFSRFFRLMTESYAYLNAQGAYQSHMIAYMEMAGEEGFHGLDWLTQNYHSALPTYSNRMDGTTLTPAMAIGFWLRRGLDGTNEDLWLGLREVMRRYDSEWYSNLASQHLYQSLSW